MKKPEEIKKALKLHKGGSSCTKCPYYGGFGDDYACMPGLITDVMTYIEQLEEQVQLMKIQMHGDCGVCKHRSNAQVTPAGPRFGGPCYTCMQKESRPNWEYEGLPEVKSK